MASFSATSVAKVQILLILVGILAMFFQAGLAYPDDRLEQPPPVIQGTGKPSDFRTILGCLAALPSIGDCGTDVLNIIEENKKGCSQLALSKNCCGSIFNIAAQCDLASRLTRIDPNVTTSILEACARGAASPPPARAV